MSEQQQWPTKETDLKAASAIIAKYLDLHETNSLGLFEVTPNGANEPGVRLAEWVIEMVDYFKEQYGEEQGEWVSRLVVSKYLTMGHRIH